MNKKNIEKKLYTIAEIAEKLSIQETTIRKYLNSFNLTVEKKNRKILLPETSLNFLEEIIKLKANGWTLKQIQALRSQENPDSSTINKIIENNNIENLLEKPEVKKEIVDIKLKEIIKPEAKKEIVDIKPKEIIKAEVKKEVVDIKQEETKQENIETIKNTSKNLEELICKKEDDENNFDENLTKDYINKEITIQSRKVSKLQKFISMKNISFREHAEMKLALNNRFIFLAGLRYIRDNWISKAEVINN